MSSLRTYGSVFVRKQLVSIWHANSTLKVTHNKNNLKFTKQTTTRSYLSNISAETKGVKVFIWITEWFNRKFQPFNKESLQVKCCSENGKGSTFILLPSWQPAEQIPTVLLSFPFCDEYVAYISEEKFQTKVRLISLTTTQSNSMEIWFIVCDIDSLLSYVTY